MRSSQNVAIVKIPFRSRPMAFSNNRLLLLFPWERGFAIGNSGTQLATVVLNLQQWYSICNSGTGDPSMLHHEQTIFGEEIHTLITFMVSVMASNTVNGL